MAQLPALPPLPMQPSAGAAPAVRSLSHGGRPTAPDLVGEIMNPPDEARNTDPQDSKYIWMLPYMTPWNDPNFADNYQSWKSQVYTTYQMRKPDEEYRAQFVPGIGSLRPFVKQARPVPPTELLWAFTPGVLGADAGNTGGFVGFLISCWVCYTTGACGPDPAPRADPTSGYGGETKKDREERIERQNAPKTQEEKTVS